MRPLPYQPAAGELVDALRGLAFQRASRANQPLPVIDPRG